MKNNYFVVRLICYDPNDLKGIEGRELVSFDIAVLDKYKNNATFKLNIPNNVGTLKTDRWELPIDVHEHYVNTWLYKLASLPDEEQQHFADYNIHPCPMSLAANNKWNLGGI